jgi:hypothetical protein
MRIESSVTSLSWIPLGATEGFNRLTFRLLRVAHFDPPRPDVLRGPGRAAGDRPLPAGQPARGLDRGPRRPHRRRRPGRRRPHQPDQGGLRRGQHRLHPRRPARPAAQARDRPQPGAVRPDHGRVDRLPRPPPGPPRALCPDRGAGDLIDPRPDHPRRRDGRAAVGRGQPLPPGTGSTTTVVDWVTESGLSTMTPGGVRRTAPTAPGCRGVPDRDGGVIGGDACRSPRLAAIW